MSRADHEIQNLLTDSDIGVKEKIELLRLQLDSERLAAERRKFKSEQKFLTKHFAAVLTAIISLAAVLVSFSQVWVAKIHQEKELSVAQSQKDREMQATQDQKEKETILLVEQQKRAWKLELAKFIAEHKGELLGKNIIQKELMRNVILTTFPAEISADFFAKLEVVSTSPEERRALRVIRKEVIPQIRTLPELPPAKDELVALFSGQISTNTAKLSVSDWLKEAESSKPASAIIIHESAPHLSDPEKYCLR
jgi:hypothetical protein